uniref:Aminotran_5 domain-containing protein n=1 Tax=Heterorhabditis bacteriophora TaxID=37862 RepID=A0A1I7XEY0_HETBA
MKQMADFIKGLPNALETPGVCSNYSHLYCEKTFQELQNFKERGIRDKANLIYATSLGKLFGIDCYLEALKKVAQEKNIDVRTRHNLVEVDTQKRIATFELLDEKANSNGRTTQIERVS